MRCLALALALILLGPGASDRASERAADKTSRTWRFDGEEPGRPPVGFSFAGTGGGAPGRWVVERDSTAPSGGLVLAQLDADASDRRFPMAVAEAPLLKDLRLSVKCKAVSGRTDQACGLVLRYADENNYYLARANVLENNVRFYLVRDGSRRQLASWSGKVEAARWNELAVEARGDRFRVSWNGAQVLEVADRTFAGGGRVGIWTKADSVTYFDDLSVGSLTPPDRVENEEPRDKLDPALIERLTGTKGSFDAGEGVFRVSVPRSDLSVTVAGFRMTPPLGLTSWAAFKRAGGRTLVMGDLVLLEDQVNPVMDIALDSGLEVTALHNHFLWDSPKVMFMHIAGTGIDVELATAVGKVFAKIRVSRGDEGTKPTADLDSPRTSIATNKIEAVLGLKGELTQGVYRVTFGRETRMHGEPAGGAMGVNTWAAFAGSDERAVVDGDFAVLESELQAVLKALRTAGIDIVAIHHHMTHEEPRMLFLHYWGVGRAEALARGIRAALDRAGGPPRSR